MEGKLFMEIVRAAIEIVLFVGAFALSLMVIVAFGVVGISFLSIVVESAMAKIKERLSKSEYYRF